MSRPLKNMANAGNTCWCASAIQALRSVRVFAKLFPRTTLLGRALNDDEVPDALVSAVYAWARTLLTATYAGSPEDPAEFLVRLFDQPNVPEQLFTSTRCKITCCERCHHVRAVKNEENLLIIPYIPTCLNPLQKALHADFGYKVRNENAEVAAETYRDIVAPVGERWWRCDDDVVRQVVLSVVTPYLLFYVERGATWSLDEENLASDDAKVPAYGDIQNTLEKHVNRENNLALDCEGECQKKTSHAVFVNNYETGSAVVVHVSMPRRVNMACVERTLFDAGDGAPFELTAIVCRVGGSHYVCYRRELSIG